MFEVNILTRGLHQYKSRGILFPLLRYCNQLRKRGIECSVYRNAALELTDCNTLIVEDNLFKSENAEFTLDYLRRIEGDVDQLLWFDTTDSTGTVHDEAISIVDQYYKKQLLRNRERYLEPMYGSRPFTSFYHRKFEVDDNDEVDEGELQPHISSQGYLDKLGISWHIGLIPKTPFQNRLWHTLERLPDSICRVLPWGHVFDASPLWQSPSTDRTVDVSGRFTTNYSRSTVEFHRKLMDRELSGWFESEKVGRMEYLQELRSTKILLSPFGYGEICHRDFEGFLSGCLVVKPEMDHLETWPPLYEGGETIVEVPWDMSGASETLETVLNEYDRYRAIAEQGQQRFRNCLTGEEAAERFVDHFAEIVQE